MNDDFYIHPCRGGNIAAPPQRYTSGVPVGQFCYTRMSGQYAI